MRVGCFVEDKKQDNDTDDSIDGILREMQISFSKYDIITPTTLNSDLKKLTEKKEFKNEDYNRLKKEVLEPNKKKIDYDIQSYVSMIKLSPTFMEAKFWIVCLLADLNYEEYCNNLTQCRELASSAIMARYSIDNSVAFFDYWKNIMDDIGYEPGNPDSFTKYSDKPKKSQFKNDYDYYWSTRWEHLCREMHNYCATGRRDNERLKSIKEQIQVFDDKGEELPVFKFMTKQHNEVVDFRAIIREKIK